jgi:hypothetical protein
MAIQMDDGSLLIHGALDGLSVPLEPIVKVKSVETPTLLQHQIEHGGPATLNAAARPQKIKDLIKERQLKQTSLTFVKAWAILQQKRPELFD